MNLNSKVKEPKASHIIMCSLHVYEKGEYSFKFWFAISTKEGIDIPKAI
jgi:hypothetical protein